ncbi:GNAT family N-acetyltransferase [Carnobacteriaceae bacterium zg-C25]|nr:GNAT family N-acetyltransferase [Carnobacteriaceae bacterium zg-C25]
MIELKPLTRQDVNEASCLVVSVWKKHYRGLLSQSFLQKLSPNAHTEKFKRQIDKSDGYLYGAYDGDVLVGVLQALDTEDGIHLKQLCVKESAQRQGIGKRLLTVLPPNRSVKAHVIVGNTVAHAFYEKNGFKKTGERMMSEYRGGRFAVDVYVRNNQAR